VSDLEKGYLFDYDLETWTVLKMSEYDWGDQYFSREFLIESRGKKRFLHLEDDDGLVLTLSEKLKIRTLSEDVMTALEKKGKPPKKINYNGILFYRNEEAPGHYRDVENDNWEALISWDYEDAEEVQCLSIEQWGENEYEASHGHIIAEKEISNILPFKTNSI
jgi:hypothetical protein